MSETRLDYSRYRIQKENYEEDQMEIFTYNKIPL
jgi:hypothetical protein